MLHLPVSRKSYCIFHIWSLSVEYPSLLAPKNPFMKSILLFLWDKTASLYPWRPEPHCSHRATAARCSSGLLSVSGYRMLLCCSWGLGQSPQLSIVLSRNALQTVLTRPKTFSFLHWRDGDLVNLSVFQRESEDGHSGNISCLFSSWGNHVLNKDNFSIKTKPFI